MGHAVGLPLGGEASQAGRAPSIGQKLGQGAGSQVVIGPQVLKAAEAASSIPQRWAARSILVVRKVKPASCSTIVS